MMQKISGMIRETFSGMSVMSVSQTPNSPWDLKIHKISLHCEKDLF